MGARQRQQRMVRLIVLSFVWMFVLSGSDIESQAQPKVVDVQVVGAESHPLPSVRIDFRGPTRAVRVTDKEGKAKLKLAVGVYRIRVSQRNRRMDFEKNIESDTTNLRLKVRW
jgi:hypothetical protein